MVTGPAPRSRDIIRSVSGGLGFNNALSPAIVPEVTFEPSIGITAGRIDKLGMDIRSMRVPLLRAIKTVMIPSIRRNFDVGGRPAPWAALAPFTVQRRAALGFGPGPILVRTGTLRSAATQINIWRVSDKSAVVTHLPERAWYGKIHQAGHETGSMKALITKHNGDYAAAYHEHTKRISSGEGTAFHFDAQIPARPFLIIQEEDKLAIAEVFSEWLAERVNAAWGVSL